MPDVLYEVNDQIAFIQLNRPARGNAWTWDMDDELERAFANANEAANVKVIVLSGSGEKFSLGMDLGNLEELISAGNLASALEGRLRVKCDPSASPKPVIAALNGSAAGVGLALALMCDIRVASNSAKFSFSYVRRGLVAEQAESWFLQRIVGLGPATDLLLTGRVFDAAEALRIGLISRTVDPNQVLEVATTIAREIADCNSPVAMRAVKQQLANERCRRLSDARDHAEVLVRHSLESDDVREGVMSFIESRPPRFPPLTEEPGNDG